MKFLSCERISEHKYKTPEGYLVCVDSVLARTGKQTYKRREVFGIDCKDAENDIEVDRKAEEVFSDKTLASFENKPLTVEHPDEDVNINNHNDLSVGFVRDIKRGKTDKGEDVMLGTLVITDAQTIEEIENGEHTDLSCGYDCDIVDEDNPQQRNIRGNHVALCQQGRAGIARIVDSVKVKDTMLQKGKVYTTRAGATLKVLDFDCSISDYNGDAGIVIKYEYASASGKNRGSSTATAYDFWRMLTDKNLTGDSIKDEMTKEEIKKEIARLEREWDWADDHNNPSEASRISIEIDALRKTLQTTKDALVEPSKDILDAFERHLQNWKINVDSQGKTWSGKIHYQVSANMSWKDFKTALHSIEKIIEMKGVPMTFNAGFDGEKCTAGIDLDKQHVADSVKDDASDDWTRAIWKENLQFEFISGGYGMRFKSQKDYTRAKELAKKYRMTNGHWHDKDLEYFDYGSTQIGNEDSVKDDLRSGLYKFEVQITAAPPYTPYKMYVYAKDVQEVRDKVKISNPKYGIGRIIKKEKITDALKKFEVQFKDAKGRTIVQIIKAKDLKDAIKKVQDTSLANEFSTELTKAGIAHSIISSNVIEFKSRKDFNRAQDITIPRKNIKATFDRDKNRFILNTF